MVALIGIKKFFVRFYLFLVSLFIFSCAYSPSSNDLLRQNEWDFKNIPDKYNTGPRSYVTFNKISQSGYISENVYLMIRTDTNQYCLSASKNKVENFPDKVVISNYDFSDYDFVVQNSNRFPCNKYIVFENCKFKGFRNDAASKDDSRIYFTFNYCSFSGGVSSSYLTLNNCKIGGFTTDAMNPLREVYCNNLYIYDLLHEGNTNGTHLDGIQIYGDQRSRNNVIDGYWVSQVETGEIHYKNVRFEIPSIHFEGNTSAVNACVMFQLEFSDVDNCSFEDLYVNGGGKWYPLYLGTYKNADRSVNGKWSHKNLVMKNAMVSNNFGTIFYSNTYDATLVENVEHHDCLFVTSVFKDSSGTAHIIVTNDTNSDKELMVFTDKGVHNFKVPHCPSNWALGGEIDKKVNPNESLADLNGKSYLSYRWADMPFDLDYTISENPKYILCYQGKKQIRYVSFDGNDHYLNLDWLR